MIAAIGPLHTLDMTPGQTGPSRSDVTQKCLTNISHRASRGWGGTVYSLEMLLMGWHLQLLARRLDQSEEFSL